MLEQDRINSMISYFFLGPLFLLARAGTPLASPSVREHAKRSSMIISISLLIGVLYFFIRPYIQYSPFGFDLRTILLTLIITGCIIALMHGAYQAYRGLTGELRSFAVSESILRMGNISDVYSVERDEDRVRILASMLPWVGIYLSHRYQNPLMERARILGSFCMILIIFTLLLGGADGFMVFLITAVYIGLFATVAVSLFVYERFIIWDILTRIPSYRTIEAHIVATLRSSIDFIGVVFGKDATGSYSTYLEEAKILKGEIGEIPPYFMPVWIIALPIINLIILPSFFRESYQVYRFLIIQGFLITLLFLGIVFSGSYQEAPLLLLLLFPIVHIAVYARSDILSRAPLIGIWIHMIPSYGRMKSHIENIANTKETAEFRYEVTTSSEKVEDTMKREAL